MRLSSVRGGRVIFRGEFQTREGANKCHCEIRVVTLARAPATMPASVRPGWGVLVAVGVWQLLAALQRRLEAVCCPAPVARPRGKAPPRGARGAAGGANASRSATPQAKPRPVRRVEEEEEDDYDDDDDDDEYEGETSSEEESVSCA